RVDGGFCATGVAHQDREVSMIEDTNAPIEMIPLDEINVVNDRKRGKEKFKEIVASIKKLGLKKPITVTPANGKHGGGKYDLVCGQGRLLAFRSLGET